MFFEHAHIKLSILFSEKIPENFLPFSKEDILKALNICSEKDNDNLDVYNAGKHIISEEYVGVEVAVTNLIMNLSCPKLRNSIINDLKELQGNLEENKIKIKKTETSISDFSEEFKVLSDEELIEVFNREVGNNGWTSSRAKYLAALDSELKKRNFDCSAIRDEGLSFKNKIELVRNKIKIKNF
jgi:hypothetical protein